MARLIISTACFINPGYFILSGLHIKQDLKALIEKSIAGYDVVKMRLPQIEIIDDTRKLYFYYLVDAGLEYVYSCE